MKTQRRNNKVILVLIALVGFSMFIINSMVSPSAKEEAGSTASEKPEAVKPNLPVEPVNNESVESPDVMQASSYRVDGFTPEFDNEWCSKTYPSKSFEKISLASGDVVITDKKGGRITDYNELSLKLAPGAEEDPGIEKQQAFEDAYIDVKGVGPMKLKSIKFRYAAN